MNISVTMAYKRECFSGKGLLARILDRMFLSLLGALAVYTLLLGKPSRWSLSLLTGASLGIVLTLLDGRRFNKYMAQKRRETGEWLQRVRFIQMGGEKTLPKGEKAVLSLNPVTLETLQNHCLFHPRQTFRLYQNPDEALIQGARALGCEVRFCPEAWMNIAIKEEEVEALLISRAPVRKGWGDWKKRLARISGKRFLLAGALLTLFSYFLPHSLLFRLLGTAAFAYGGLSLTVSLVKQGEPSI